MRKFCLKGETVEERLNSAEVALKHAFRRLHKTVVGVIPPVPIFTYVQHPLDDGTIMTAVMPAGGRIRKGALAVRTYNHPKAIEFECSVERASGSYSEKFTTKKPVYLVDLGIDILAGDVITVKVDKTRTDDDSAWAIEGIWISFLFDMRIEDMAVVNRMIDELERIEDERVRGLTD